MGIPSSGRDQGSSLCWPRGPAYTVLRMGVSQQSCVQVTPPHHLAATLSGQEGRHDEKEAGVLA